MQQSTAPADPVPEVAGVAVSAVGVELRRRRLLLGWSQVAAAKESGVSRNIINEVEAGKRRPSLRTYEKLRECLGLQVPPTVLVPPRWRASPDEQRLVRLAAAVIAVRECSLASLASGLAISIPAVREGLVAIAGRLAAVGVRTFDDGFTIRLSPIPEVAADVAAVTTVEDVETLSADALAVLMVLGTIGEGSRRDVEDWRREDSAGILERLRKRGFIQATTDQEALGHPNRYRLTAKALVAVGYPTAEAFREFCLSIVEASADGGEADHRTSATALPTPVPSPVQPAGGRFP